jgi:hypothetical protein
MQATHTPHHTTHTHKEGRRRGVVVEKGRDGKPFPIAIVWHLNPKRREMVKVLDDLPGLPATRNGKFEYGLECFLRNFGKWRGQSNIEDHLEEPDTEKLMFGDAIIAGRLPTREQMAGSSEDDLTNLSENAQALGGFLERLRRERHERRLQEREAQRAQQGRGRA